MNETFVLSEPAAEDAAVRGADEGAPLNEFEDFSDGLRGCAPVGIAAGGGRLDAATVSSGLEPAQPISVGPLAADHAADQRFRALPKNFGGAAERQLSNNRTKVHQSERSRVPRSGCPAEGCLVVSRGSASLG